MKAAFFLYTNYTSSPVMLSPILMRMKPKRFFGVHFFHSKLAELILGLFNAQMIVVERYFFDALQIQVDFLKSQELPYHLLFHHLSDLEARRMLTSGYGGPIDWVHPKNGKRFSEKTIGSKNL